MSEELKAVTRKHLVKRPRSEWSQVWKSCLVVAKEKDSDVVEEDLRKEFDELCREVSAERGGEFESLSLQALEDILGLTIKKDNMNKVVTFLCQLSAFTESSQFNIQFNAPSSTGKSYLPLEIARLFPQEDVREFGYVSPSAFFHEAGELDKERKGVIVVDLSRKILIFLDQPHTDLLTRLRPLLSHDKKEIHLKITDKSQKQGLRTKNVILKGFPAVIFCTAGLKNDEQESTRFFLLSPETSQEKIRDGIYEKIRRESDGKVYSSALEENPQRKLLKERLLAIKFEQILDVRIDCPERINERFIGSRKHLKPRYQRDIGRILDLIKAHALINLWFRQRDGDIIVANDDDIGAAFSIWDEISESQELNLAPYVYRLYQEVIVPGWEEKNGNRNPGFVEATGFLCLTRQEVLQKHSKTYGRMLDSNQLRQQILPSLESAGLIIQEPDPSDKRRMLVCPAVASVDDEQQNSELEGGITAEDIVNAAVG